MFLATCKSAGMRQADRAGVAPRRCLPASSALTHHSALASPRLGEQRRTMSLNRTVDVYCERVDASFWSEPLNAITNVSFVLAAWLLWRELSEAASRRRALAWRRSARSPGFSRWSARAASCSTPWRPSGQDWLTSSRSCCLAASSCTRSCGIRLGLSRWIALTGAFAFGVASYFTPRFLPAGFLNQSGAYFPYIAGLLGIVVWLKARAREGWRMFAAASLCSACRSPSAVSINGCAGASRWALISCGICSTASCCCCCPGRLRARRGGQSR